MSEHYDTVKEILEEEPESVQDLLDGEDGAENYLVGQVMQATGGQADPQEAVSLIKEVIHKERVEWPVTFTVHRRPVSKTTVGERLATDLPSWLHDEIPRELEDPSPYEFEFEVTVYKDGSLEVEQNDA